ncbi:MAG: RHS repeat-associated core domain-containing protein, partial [Planctomycetes bacterium]|nr:RHS repeat-associated core domain-containing protein [Planctomycetota bacterium]
RLNGSSWENYYLLHGGQDTAAKLVNTSGVVVEQYEYDPYGRVSVYVGSSTHPVASSAYGLPFLWKSIRLDEITGLLQMRNRYYSTELGRFLTRDPIGGWSDVANIGNEYCYCGNRPSCLLDPLGTQTWLQAAWSWATEAAGAIVNVAKRWIPALVRTFPQAALATAAVWGLSELFYWSYKQLTNIPAPTGGAEQGPMRIQPRADPRTEPQQRPAPQPRPAPQTTDVAPPPPIMFYRYGKEWECSDVLLQKAGEALAAGFPHGVSFSTKPHRRGDHSCATLEDITAAGFLIVKTGGPNHYTLVLPEFPEPRTPEDKLAIDAEKALMERRFNEMLKR